ncbi:YIP1 family protein [Myxococcus stipitatus]|uniref:Yip1 family protein n=1 Tax=Myxococcus stipitatus TaxID=83455 RepID=UPI001F3BCA91|nr:Yip1 family protein [Myxococcus stipitatus]MCE9671712.1 YIP1 family protein [Myxococcus stipitatus]
MPGIPCPSCQAYIIPGAQFCGKCGHSFLRQSTPESGEPVCSVHPEYVSVQACERCGAFSCARCLNVGARGEALCTKCFAREPDELLAWDRREEVGLVKAFWQTCLDVMLRPGATFDRARPTGSMGNSVLFVALAYFVSMFTTLVLYALVMGVMPWDSMMAKQEDAPSGMMVRGMMAGVFIVYLFLIPLFGTAWTLAHAGVDHLVLRMAGVPSTYAVTLRAHALSMGPYLVGLVPFCGAYVFPFWSMGVRVVAYRGMHRTSGGKAALGALVAPVAFMVLGCGLYIAMMAFVFSTLPGAR